MEISTDKTDEWMDGWMGGWMEKGWRRDGLVSCRWVATRPSHQVNRKVPAAGTRCGGTTDPWNVWTIGTIGEN